MCNSFKSEKKVFRRYGVYTNPVNWTFDLIMTLALEQVDLPLLYKSSHISCLKYAFKPYFKLIVGDIM